MTRPRKAGNESVRLGIVCSSRLRRGPRADRRPSVAHRPARRAIRRLGRLRRLPPDGKRRLARVASRRRHAGGQRQERARKVRRRDLSQGRRGKPLLSPRRQILRPHRRPGWPTKRFRIQIYVRPLSAAAISDRLAERPAASFGESHGTRGRRAQGGQQLVRPLSRPQNLPPGDPLHWTGIDQNWNYQCAWCHSTDLRKHHDPATAAFRHHLVGNQRRLRSLSWAGFKSSRLGARRPPAAFAGEEKENHGLCHSSRSAHGANGGSTPPDRLSFAAGDRHTEELACAGCHARRRNSPTRRSTP